MSSGTARHLAELAVAFAVGAVTWAATPVDLIGAVVAASLAAVVHLLLGRGLARRGSARLGAANRLTLLRAWLTCAVAALVVGWQGAGRPTALLLLAGTALLLDAVDGQVARRTGTASTLGARFDMEVDALLILVLSMEVARATGWWVLGLGVARYAVLAGAVVAPWLRVGVAPRLWRKTVAAVQGVVLTVAAGMLLPPPWTTLALAVAAGLLGLSFVTEVAELWRTRVRGAREVGAVPATGRPQAESGLPVGAS